MKEYYIFKNENVTQESLYSLVTEVTHELPHRPKYFIATCSDAQVKALENHPDVKQVADFAQTKLDNPLSEDATKTVTHKRRTSQFNHILGNSIYANNSTYTNAYTPVFGNWGLIRHSSQTNNVTYNTSTSSTYTYTYDGTGVDIILNLASVVDLYDPEFMTSGVTRLQQFQWNTLTGMSSLPTVDYTRNGTGSTGINAHAEAVAYLTAGNTYGWATGSSLYVWPRDQIDGSADLLEEYGWDCFRLFHQNKGNSRPTIVVDAIGYNKTTPYYSGRAVMFRGTKYSSVAGAGGAERPLSVQKGADLAFGQQGEFYGTSNAGQFRLFLSGANPSASTIETEMSDLSNTYGSNGGNLYATHIEPIEDMIAAGVHHVSSAGNNRNVIVNPDHPDYNNGFIQGWTLSNGTEADYYIHPTNRPNFCLTGDTIACAALASDFGASFGFGGKETLADFSTRGDRVDTCAAGQLIEMNLRNNGFYNATGTSFASPNVGGMAALVLGKYPSTTPRQLRRYFREQAVGTDELYDSGIRPSTSSKFGDISYFNDVGSNQGYSGKIAYLDPSLTFDPTTLSNAAITSSVTLTDNKLNYTKDQINTKLSTIN